MKVVKQAKYKLDFGLDDEYSWIGGALLLGEKAARDVYEELRQHFDPPSAGPCSKALAWHSESHSGWSSHDGYPTHYHSAGDVVGLHFRIANTGGNYYA